MTQQIRNLYERARALATEASQILGLDGVTAEQQARAEGLIDESTALEARAQSLERAESLSNAGAEAFEGEEREATEDLRRRAERSGDASGSIATPQSTMAETLPLDEDAQARTNVGDDGSVPGFEREQQLAREFTAALGGFVAELRSRESPESAARRAVVGAFLAGGMEGLSREQRSLVELGRRGDPRGVVVTSSVQASTSAGNHEIRTHGTGSAGSLAILLPIEMQREAMLATLAYGGWRRTRATFMPLPHGRVIPIPTIDDTANEGSFRGEHEALAIAADVVAEPNTLGAYLLRSGVFKVGYELMQDMPGDVLGNLLLSLGGIRNERRAQRAWTTDNGQSLPKGIMEGIETGTTAENATSFTPTDWYQLFESVDSSYHDQAEVALSNNALTKLKVMQGGIGQGLWQPGLAAGQPSSIDGHPYSVMFSLDSVASGNKPAVYGDLSWHFIREVVPTAIIRYVEKFAPDIGYEVVNRTDSRPINPGVAPFKALLMP